MRWLLREAQRTPITRTRLAPRAAQVRQQLYSARYVSLIGSSWSPSLERRWDGPSEKRIW